MSDERLQINSDGYTIFSPSGVVSTECKFDLSLFPFDTQHCQIIIEEWRYASQFVKLEPEEEGYLMLRVEQLEQWTISQGSFNFFNVKYTYNESAYDSAIYYIILKRKPGFYLLNTIVPSIVISLTEAISFSIPINCDARLELSFTCILAFGMFQGYVAADLPRSADNPPLLSIYIVVMSTYIFLATCFHGLARVCHDYGNKGAQVPKWLTLRLWEGSCQKWKELAKRCDKIAMTIYAFLVLVTPLVFFIVLPYCII